MEDMETTGNSSLSATLRYASNACLGLNQDGGRSSTNCLPPLHRKPRASSLSAVVFCEGLTLLVLVQIPTQLQQ